VSRRVAYNLPCAGLCSDFAMILSFVTLSSLLVPSPTPRQPPSPPLFPLLFLPRNNVLERKRIAALSPYLDSLSHLLSSRPPALPPPLAPSGRTVCACERVLACVREYRRRRVGRSGDRSPITRLMNVTITTITGETLGRDPGNLSPHDTRGHGLLLHSILLPLGPLAPSPLFISYNFIDAFVHFSGFFL
jgi:hypothetical protein